MTEFYFDPKAPLAKYPGETDTSHQALIDYIRMPKSAVKSDERRSLRNLHKKYLAQLSTGHLPPSTSLPTIKTWSTRYKWQVRVALAEAQVQEQDIIDWKQRQQEVRENAWEDYHSLRELAQQIIEAAPPFVNKSVSQGEPAVVDEHGQLIRPGKATIISVQLNTVALARIIDLNRKLAEVAIDKKDKLAYYNLDLSTLDYRQLERIAAGEDPLDVLLSSVNTDTGES